MSKERKIQTRGMLNTFILTRMVVALLYENTPLISTGLDDFSLRLEVLCDRNGIKFFPRDEERLDMNMFVTHIADLPLERYHVDKSNDPYEESDFDYKSKELFLNKDGTWIAWRYNKESGIGSFRVTPFVDEVTHWIDDDIDLGLKIFNRVAALVAYTIDARKKIASSQGLDFYKVMEQFERLTGK